MKAEDSAEDLPYDFTHSSLPDLYAEEVAYKSSPPTETVNVLAAEDYAAEAAGDPEDCLSFGVAGDLLDLDAADVKQLLLAFSTILEASLRGSQLPLYKWLQTLEHDLLYDKVYDDSINAVLDNWRTTSWMDDAEVALLFVYVKRLLFTVAAEVVELRNESYLRRCLRGLRKGCGKTFSVVENMLYKTGITVVSVTIGTVLGIALGKRVTRLSL